MEREEGHEYDDGGAGDADSQGKIHGRLSSNRSEGRCVNREQRHVGRRITS